MCGVIVVDAGRSRSTNLGRDAYIHGHCLGYLHNYLFFYQFPNSNLFTHRVLFSREKPLMKSTAHGSIFIIFAFRSIFAAFIFRSIIPKTQKYLATLFIYLFYFAFYSDLFIQTHTSQSIFLPGRDLQPLLRVGLQVFSLCVHVPFT